MDIKKLLINHHFWMMGLVGLIFSSCSSRFKNVEDEAGKKLYNVKYGENERQSMDVFLPAKFEKESATVIIVHGGAWKYGNKEHVRIIQKFLYQNNIPSVNINYRLLKNGILYTDQLEDIGKAVTKSKEMAAEWRINPDNIILLGESAGAHLSLLYGYNNPDKISKLISLSGPTDLYSEEYLSSSYHKRTRRVFQNVVGEKFADNLEAFKKASPLGNVSAVPTLIFQGDKDLLVNRKQGLALDSVLTEQKIPHQLILMKDAGHIPRFVRSKRETIIFPAILSFVKEED
ncbi:alpha/beta hydrolase [Chryseobacterium sp. MP_3.2]|uniref:alpha/beta hydrolase n=1 Tax=Chryseobacterium sp. MP_3.2 TaxID=3071712 RepID=UPI002DFD2ADB|nr:acetyl esterase/lipase [Chryseobacterium sp. MP_3.2]